MLIELRERTEENVITYFNRTQDAEVRRFLPQKAGSVGEALDDYRRTLLPGASSYGRTIYADGAYAGDVWCYCIQDGEPNAMLSYCVFDRQLWGQGVATRAVRLFLAEVREKLCLKSVGTFTFSANTASLRVLERCGFSERETIVEDGAESKYYQLEL